MSRLSTPSSSGAGVQMQNSRNGDGDPGRPAAAGSSTSNENDIRVDFIQRTMLEREASGKRKIKPTFFSDTGLGEDSDDPDFDVDDVDDSNSEHDGSSGSSSDTTENGESDSASDDDNGSESEEDDHSSSAEESPSDSDASGPKKTSVLKDFMEKARDAQLPIKKKRKRKPKLKVDTKNKSQDSIQSSIQEVIASASKAGSSNKGLSNGTSKKKGKPKKVVRKPKANDRNKKRSNSLTSDKAQRGGRRLKKQKTHESLSQLITAVNYEMEGVRNSVHSRDPICAICLGDNKANPSEMVECDQCRMICHEDCYNAMEDDFSGTPSSSSTAPWFCDACKSRSLNICCELCPNPGGLFKQTKHKTWVHKVCALYTPGIYSGSNTGAPDLTTIRDSKWGVWGAKGCIACPDERLSRIGIPVKCDAALCKEYLHVSCAQRLGLLSDPSRCSSNEADPFYVSCRAHLSSDLRRKQVESHKAMVEQLRQRRLKESKSPERIKIKLVKAQHTFCPPDFETFTTKWENNMENTRIFNIPIYDSMSTGANECATSPPPKKRSRFLDNSAMAVFSNEKKVPFTEHADYVSAILLQERHEKIVANVKKRWNVNPALSVEFAAYYYDRQRRIDELTKKCKKEKKINKNFCEKEVQLNSELESRVVEQMEANDEHFKLSSELKSLQNIIKAIVSGTSTKQRATPASARRGSSPSHASPNSKKVVRSLSRPGPKVSTDWPSNVGKNSTKTDKGVHPGLALHRCCVCSKIERQHLIILCDKCKNYYHLGCLDPPLSKKPRITQTCGWMCAECDEKDKEEDEESHPVDVDAPRSLRGRTNIKRPVKYQNDFSEYENVLSPKMGKMIRVKSRSPDTRRQEDREKRRKRIADALPVFATEEKLPSFTSFETCIVKQERESHSPEPKELHSPKVMPIQMKVPSMFTNGNRTDKPKPQPRKRSTKGLNGSSGLIINGSISFSQTNGSCVTCRRKDNTSNLVTCDKCKSDFHFGCLNPPLKYTPRRRGYSWFCVKCDDPDEDL